MSFFISRPRADLDWLGIKAPPTVVVGGLSSARKDSTEIGWRDGSETNGLWVVMPIEMWVFSISRHPWIEFMVSTALSIWEHQEQFGTGRLLPAVAINVRYKLKSKRLNVCVSDRSHLNSLTVWLKVTLNHTDNHRRNFINMSLSFRPQRTVN